MDFDLSQIRAFVAAAEERHFGRAAERLFLSQQGLSKRIQRLEQQVGTPLFTRRHNRVELTETGRLLVPRARELLAVAEAASDHLRQTSRPLRIDVWGQVHSAMQVVAEIAHTMPDVVPQLSMRRSTSAALAALDAGGVDVAFGRPFDLDVEVPDGVGMQPMCIERLGAAISTRHELAGVGKLTVAMLRRTGLWWPAAGGGQEELIGFLNAFGARFGIPVTTAGTNLGLDEYISALQEEPHRVGLFGLDWQLPPGADLTVVEVEPTPLFLWWAMWRTDDPHPKVADFLNRGRDLQGGALRRQLDDSHNWLPDPDRASARTAGLA